MNLNDGNDDSEDDSFSKVGLSDAESVCTQKAKVTPPQVEVTLPDFFTSDQETTTTNDTMSSWSLIQSAAPDDGSSVVSGFDLISLSDGTTHKRCKRCTFCNPLNETICQACNVALCANPNLSVDELLALSLQRQEEEEAFREVLSEETRRSQMQDQPIFQRSQWLANGVQEACGARSSSAWTTVVPHNNLTCLVSDFIEHAEEARGSRRISLVYGITGSSTRQVRDIYQNGFAVGSRLGSSPKAAKELHQQVTTPYQQLRQSKQLLQTIQEEGSSNRASSVGWIVALVCDGNAYNMQGFGCIHVVQEKQGQTLPLVHFPAHKIEDKSLSGVVDGLTQVFRDAFPWKFWDARMDLLQDPAYQGGPIDSKATSLSTVPLTHRNWPPQAKRAHSGCRIIGCSVVGCGCGCGGNHQLE